MNLKDAIGGDGVSAGPDEEKRREQLAQALAWKALGERIVQDAVVLRALVCGFTVDEVAKALGYPFLEVNEVDRCRAENLAIPAILDLRKEIVLEITRGSGRSAEADEDGPTKTDRRKARYDPGQQGRRRVHRDFNRPPRTDVGNRAARG